MIIIDLHLKVISVAVFIVCLLLSWVILEKTLLLKNNVVSAIRQMDIWGKRQKDVFFRDDVLNLPNIVCCIFWWVSTTRSGKYLTTYAENTE